MVKLTFNETTYEFKVRNGNYYNSLHIFVNGEFRKVKQQCSTTPKSIEECLELINYYEL